MITAEAPDWKGLLAWRRERDAGGDAAHALKAAEAVTVKKNTARKAESAFREE